MTVSCPACGWQREFDDEVQHLAVVAHVMYRHPERVADILGDAWGSFDAFDRGAIRTMVRGGLV